jgi:hypothetical protein
MDKKENKEFYDFTQVLIEGIDGSKSPVDMSKEVANLMFGIADSLEVHLASQELFKTGKCEKTEAVTEKLKSLVENAFFYRFKVAIQQMI